MASFRMKDRFIELVTRMGGKGDFNAAFEALAMKYSGAGRYYHTFRHIRQCLDEYSEARDLAVSPNTLEFALWYHDIAYNIKSKNNEAVSARLAFEAAAGFGLPRFVRQGVFDLIMLTKHDAVPEIEDGRIIADIDLSILGRPVKEFDAYEESIRKEYSKVRLNEFKKGRRKILRGFLDRPRIYLTDFFGKKYEAQARANLERSVGRLS
jgi:predicted metal-dependent HD superfamily phosphohydrolase